MQSESTSWTVLRSLDGFPATLYIEAENLQWQKITSAAQPETSWCNDNQPVPRHCSYAHDCFEYGVPHV